MDGSNRLREQAEPNRLRGGTARLGALAPGSGRDASGQADRTTRGGGPGRAGSGGPSRGSAGRAILGTAVGELLLLGVCVVLWPSGAGAAIVVGIAGNVALGALVATGSGGRQAWATVAVGVACGAVLSAAASALIDAVAGQPDGTEPVPPVLLAASVAIGITILAEPVALTGAVVGSAIVDLRAGLRRRRMTEDEGTPEKPPNELAWPSGGTPDSAVEATARSTPPALQTSTPGPRLTRPARLRGAAILAAGLWVLIVGFVGLALVQPARPASPPAIDPSSDPAAAAIASLAAAAADSDLVLLDDVPVGSCYVEHVDVTTGRIPGVLTVACAGPHQMEMLGHGTLPYASDAPYPGGAAIDSAAGAVCRPLFESYVGVDYDSSIWTFWYYTPSEATWSLDRRVDCAIGNEDQSMMPGGSARASRR